MELTLLINRLEELPASIALKSEEVETAREAYERAQVELKALEAQTFLELKVQDPRANATILKNRVANTPEVFDKQLELVGIEAVYRKKEVERQKLDDEFTGCRVVARIKMTELTSIEWNKGGRNGSVV